MFRVGLTGGIASGKSTISQLFSRLGVCIVDTDIISHQLMQKGATAYSQTVEHFGKNILSEDGHLNRSRLREIIFNDPQQKKWLEQMIHPLIRLKTEEMIHKVKDGEYVLVVVPLMFETGFNQLLDHVVAIDCPVEVQLDRLTSRDSIDKKLALEMIASQMDNQLRLTKADSVITNSDTLNRNQDVLMTHHKLLKLAQLSE